MYNESIVNKTFNLGADALAMLANRTIRLNPGDIVDLRKKVIERFEEGWAMAKEAASGRGIPEETAWSLYRSEVVEKTIHDVSFKLNNNE